MTKRAELAAADSAGGIMSAPAMTRYTTDMAGAMNVHEHGPWVHWQDVAARDAQWQARLDAAVKEERAACAQACEDALTLHGAHSNFICARYIKHRTA